MINVLENPAIRQLAQPLTVASYHLLRDCGAVGIKTELLRGVVTSKITKTPLHEYLVERLMAALRDHLPPGYFLRKEGPLTFADSEPEPDISVVKGKPKDFRQAHPTTALLVVEVAVSSLSIDREKAALCAAAGIPCYWLVNAQEQSVEVSTDPEPEGYRQCDILTDTLVSPFGQAIHLHDLF
ncbi:Uma2 family endonuclease [Thiorhodovibrio frisius]|uniref:Putative restriction endonuclease domain-containing protein n=1 Tax=Thiorhodovibrio frisius TaxID=631362 RepID=H8YWA4_9GAMM|nr:Uma2 family endonuclease [Thiorhodovibrio frisius]EIC23707.1 hypothetical protein Thi970DRAFT_00206 [Thiorhodovibrio frisius]WPL20096.1 hypothetical protein Thiofri_00152 [Thiorhodovibrio frisius]